MKNKKGAIEMSMTTIVTIVLVVVTLVLALVLIRAIFNNNPQQNNFSTEWYNFSSPQYNYTNFSNLDYLKPINGTQWYGVNGVYSTDKPLIFGENNYTYWIENNSYYVIPGTLIPDKFHVSQSVNVTAIPIRNVTMKLWDTWNLNLDYVTMHYIGDPQDNYMGYFEMHFYPNPQNLTLLPFGGDLIIESNNQMRFQCTDNQDSITQSYTPAPYTNHELGTASFTFKLSNSFDTNPYYGDNIDCQAIAPPLYNLTNSLMYVSIYPANTFMSNGQLNADVWNQNTYEFISQPIYQGEFNITK